MADKSKVDPGDKSAPFVFDPEYVSSRLLGWFPELSEATLDNLVAYQGELVRFSKTINLISTSTVRTAESVHIADAVHASRLISPRLQMGHSLYDLGSGNGIPGLVFAILYPETKVVLVDRDSRKMEFCKHVASKIKLLNIEIMMQQVEHLPESSLVNAVARGFSPLPKALLSCRRLFAKGGRFFHLKGDAWATELGAVPSQLFSHWSPGLLGQYRLPDTNAEMAVILTEKISG